jgi:WD40 repeat protein
VATGDDRGLSQIWDARDGRLLATLPGRSNRGVEIAISSDGRTLATAGQDGLLKLWDIRALVQPWPTLARDVCRTLLGEMQRTFSADEIKSDSLLGSLWPDPNRDVCSGSD